ncbi:MAG: hypothetical protein WCW31_01030 [Patescibacteria group bacterium]
MPPPDEQVSGGQPPKESKASFRSITAVYAERVKPEDKRDVIAALNAAVAPEDDWKALPIARDDDTTIQVSSETMPPGAIASETIDASELIEDAATATKPADDEPAEEDLAGKEFARSVDNSGMSGQFLAAGGTKSDAPPPPSETNTSDEDLKLEILKGLRTELGITLPDSTPTKFLHKVNGVVSGDMWPTGESSEQEARRIISLLFEAGVPFGQYNRKQTIRAPLEELKTLLKMELDMRRAKKAGEEPASGQSKKRRGGPPPLPPSSR